MVVVDAVLKRLELVKADLGITKEANVVDADTSKALSDVFSLIVQANRQLNLLLDRRFAPSDVYQQVTLAISCASLLLAHFPDVKRIPLEPEYVGGKRPRDVFQRLLTCFEMVTQLADVSGVKVLHLESGAIKLDDVTPSDVYDVASLLVSELAQIHVLMDSDQEPVPPYEPGRMFPSHVFQRAGILEAQLVEMNKRVRESPDWLQPSSDRQ